MTASANKKLKDVNAITQTRLIMIAVRIAPAGVLLGLMVGGLQGVLYGLTGSILAAFAAEILSIPNAVSAPPIIRPMTISLDTRI